MEGHVVTKNELIEQNNALHAENTRLQAIIVLDEEWRNMERQGRTNHGLIEEYKALRAENKALRAENKPLREENIILRELSREDLNPAIKSTAEAISDALKISIIDKLVAYAANEKMSIPDWSLVILISLLAFVGAITVMPEVWRYFA